MESTSNNRSTTTFMHWICFCTHGSLRSATGARFPVVSITRLNRWPRRSLYSARPERLRASATTTEAEYLTLGGTALLTCAIHCLRPQPYSDVLISKPSPLGFEKKPCGCWGPTGRRRLPDCRESIPSLHRAVLSPAASTSWLPTLLRCNWLCVRVRWGRFEPGTAIATCLVCICLSTVKSA